MLALQDNVKNRERKHAGVQHSKLGESRIPQKGKLIGLFGIPKTKIFGGVLRNVPREVRQEYAKRAYDKIKDDPEFKLKNRAHAKAGKIRRSTCEANASKEERCRIKKFIIRVRRRKMVNCYYCGVVK